MLIIHIFFLYVNPHLKFISSYYRLTTALKSVKIYHIQTIGESSLMKIKKYTVYTEQKGTDLTLACVSDLHARPYDKVIAAVKKIKPDAILLPGDIVEIAAEYMNERNQNGLNFLKEASKIAPCYYTYGNHEIYFSHLHLV